MKASILMPAFNRQGYIKESIRSVQAQSEEDFELLVMDDGSEDETYKIVTQMASHDRRIRLFSRENRGMVASLNDLYTKAEGSFVFRLDSDDIWHPDHVALALDDMKQNPKCIGTFSNIQMIDHAGRVTDSTHGMSEHLLDGAGLVHFLASQNCLAVPTSCVKKKIVDDNMPFARNLQGCEDWDLWCRLAKTGLLRLRPITTAKYRLHGENESGKHWVISRQSQLSVLNEHSEELVEKYNLSGPARLRVLMRKVSLLQDLGQENNAIEILEDARCRGSLDIAGYLKLHELHVKCEHISKARGIKKILHHTLMKIKRDAGIFAGNA